VAVRASNGFLYARGFSPNINGGDSNDAIGSHAYRFGFQEDGGWSSPYPDLRINYHVGISFGANSGYGGYRFMSDYNNNTVRFQVNGGSAYTYAYTWLFVNNGIYASTNGAHFRPNTSTSYGAWCSTGSRSGWYGIAMNSGGNRPHVMFNSSGNGGFYNQDGGRWHHYYHHSNNCVGMIGSTTSSSYGLYVSKSIYSTGVITAASDIRKKKDIATIVGALDKVNQLRGVTYKRTDYAETDVRYDQTEMGVIAQEIVEVVPEVVTYAADTDEYGVSYGHLAGLFIEAIKEQTEIINNLKTEIAELKSKLGE